jgi:fatty-acyl-CoA synthase
VTIRLYRCSGLYVRATTVAAVFWRVELNTGKYELASIRKLSGGGAPMPPAVAERLEARGIVYLEGCGLTETMAPTHIHPVERIKLGARRRRGRHGVPLEELN